MKSGNRIETIPFLLLYVDIASFLLLVPFSELCGIHILPFALAIPIVATALGAYELVTANRHHSINAHHVSTAMVCIAYLSFGSVGILGQADPFSTSSLLFIASAIAMTVARRIIAIVLLSGVQNAEIHLPKRLSSMENAFDSFLSITNYPARMVIGGERPLVKISSLLTTYPDEPPTVDRDFDPLSFFRIVARALPPDVLSLSAGSIRVRSDANTGYRIVKRLFDIVVSIAALAITVPLWIIAACGILVSDGPGIFFVQTRIGQNGHPFRIVKFRTMRSVPTRGNPTEMAVKRTFKFGALLRKARIDELPQLLNVILGQMSIVGPRPEMVYYHERYVARIPLYLRRSTVKPGLTGWAQIRFPHSTEDGEYRVKTAYDLWFVENRNLAIDFYICLRTVGILLSGFGAK